MIFTETLSENWPIVLYLCVVCLFSFTVNPIALAFYLKHGPDTSTTALTVGLSINDLLSSVFFVVDITDQFGEFYDTVSKACKMLTFCYSCSAFNSILIIFAISIDRYQKICKPFKKQFTKRQGWLSLLTLTAVSAIFSAPKLVIYDIAIIIKNGSSNNYSRCEQKEIDPFTTDHYIQYISSVIDGVTAFGILVTIVYTYTNIVITLKGRKSVTDRLSIPVGSGNTVNNDNDRPDSLQAKKVKLEKMLTIVMIVVTVTLIISHVPYFVVELTNARRINERNNYLEIAIRSPYVNSALNLFIICIFNPNFRKHVSEKVCRKNR